MSGPISTETTPNPQPAHPVVATKNTPGTISLVLGIIGFLLAIALPGIAWLLLIPALILGIIGLNKKFAPKKAALAGTILGGVGWLLSIILFFVGIASAASGLSDALNEEATKPTAASSADPAIKPSADASEEPTAEEPVQELAGASIGDTVTNDDGVAFRVTGVKCNLTQVGEQYLEEKAQGQFCQVNFIVKNGSKKAVTVMSSDIKALVDDLTYESSATSNRFGDDYFATEINPNLSTKCTVFFDMPKGVKPDFIQYDPSFAFFTEEVLIAVD